MLSQNQAKPVESTQDHFKTIDRIQHETFNDSHWLEEFINDSKLPMKQLCNEVSALFPHEDKRL